MKYKLEVKLWQDRDLIVNYNFTDKSKLAIVSELSKLYVEISRFLGIYKNGY